MDEKLAGLIEAYNAACDELETAITAYEELAADADEDTIKLSRTAISDAEAKAEAAKTAKEDHETVIRARDRFKKDPAPAGGGKPTPMSVDEPDMYERGGGRSFMTDLYLSQLRHDPGAAERIAKHQAYEMDRLEKSKGEQFAVATGTLGGIIPPQYLVDLYAKAQRFGRVFADQVRGEPLPDVGMSLIVPRLTQGTDAGIQVAESDAVTTQDPTETDLTVPIRTVAGYSPVSRQTLERAAYSDTILMEDLVARYFQRLDQQLISGSGSSGQHLGVLNVSGISTATVSSWTIANAWAALAGKAGLIAQINAWAATVGAAADKIFMTPGRWGAFLGLLDSTNRPLFGIEGGGPTYNAAGQGEAPGYGRVGRMLGCDVFTDANIPTNLGSGTNEDRIIVVASPAVMLWEREDDPVTLAFEQQAGTSLQVQLVCYGYSAFTAGRYPAASGVASGAGLT